MEHLQGAGEVSLASLVRDVALDLYHATLRRGGWAAEIGNIGRGLFVADAAQAMREGDGVLWAIGEVRRGEAMTAGGPS